MYTIHTMQIIGTLYSQLTKCDSQKLHYFFITWCYCKEQNYRLHTNFTQLREMEDFGYLKSKTPMSFRKSLSLMSGGNT